MFNLSELSLFSGLAPDELEVISQCMKSITVPAKQLVVEEGEISSNLYIIESGEVEVFINSDSGNKFVLRTMTSGSYFGELAFLENSKRTASVMTSKDSHLFEISGQDFDDILHQYPSVNRLLIKNLVGLVRSLSDEIKELSSKNIYPILKQYITEHRVQEFGNRKKRDNLTPESIAKQINCPTGTIAYLLSYLENNNYISIEAEQIYIYKTLPDAFSF